jgi:hypothetical protein
MRDDIHKSAPVNAAWRRFLKHCARDADSDDRAVESAHRAIVKDCNRELSPQFLAALTGRCDDAQQTLFGGKLADINSVEDLGGNGHVLEQRVLERIRCRESANSLDQAAVEQTVTEVIQERVDSQARAMRGHVLKDRGTGAAECVQAINQGITAISSNALAKQLIAGASKIALPGSATAPVGLDDNLLKGRRGR